LTSAYAKASADTLQTGKTLFKPSSVIFFLLTAPIKYCLLFLIIKDTNKNVVTVVADVEKYNK